MWITKEDFKCGLQMWIANVDHKCELKMWNEQEELRSSFLKQHVFYITVLYGTRIV